MEKDIICIVCPNGCSLHAVSQDGVVTVTGNKCPKGQEYAEAELTNPMRTLTTSVATEFSLQPVLPVRTDGAIPKGELMNAMKFINSIKAKAPVRCGDIICENLMGFGVNLIATDDLAADSK